MTGDPLAGLPRPPGDPGTSAGVGHRYAAAAEHLEGAARQVLAEVRGLAGSDWVGRGSSSAVGCTVVLAGAFTRAASAVRTAATGLTHFSHGLAHAQAQWDHARRLADDAIQDETAYRDRAARQAEALDRQAATGDIGAAHAAASIRADAGAYVSPLRARAVALAGEATRAARTAGDDAATAVDEALAMLPPLPPAPRPDAHGVPSVGGLLHWFNDWVLGGANAAASLVGLPPLAIAGTKWWSAASAASRLPQGLQALFDETVGPLALAADRGLLPWTSVAAKARSFQVAADLFTNATEADVAARRAAFLRGGLPDSAVFEAAGKGLGVLGIAGDIGVIIEPGGSSPVEDGVNRGMAGANAVSTLVVLNAATDEIPVAGEVVMVGSGVYLGGDWLYHHWTPFHDAVDTTGHFVTHDVPNAVGHVVHDLEPWHW